MSDAFILEARDVSVSYEGRRHGFLQRSERVRAVEGVSFGVRRGQTLGLVGESGSGKSTIGKAILKLVSIDSGAIYFNGSEISRLAERAFMPFRQRIQIVFQDPYASLNPRLTVGDIVSEPIATHERSIGKSERTDRVAALLRTVGLPADSMRRYPHQFSGGQRQRICIARALSSRPELIVCDECVSALDVSVQAQIVNLLQELQEQFSLSYLFIAHDLAVVERLSHEIAVMQAGRIVEQGTAEAIYRAPKTQYAKNLLEAIPQMPSIPSV